ncbi:cytosine permease [Pantoea stewartii]|uniref:cytosine permease n=1 Tax=Pantoea stewartii TaxID=66269 RepID=UPI002DBC34B3|nr:cytosine permease [Pantoea stewartii]MEB6536498.1 cytosine permease [Pantoea stewartii]
MSLHENYSVERVPAAARLPFWGVALVHMGMLTALDQFMLGATLGHSMSYAHAFIAITAGSLIFFVATFGLGYAGMREGISGSLLARWCGFGRGGSVLVSLLIAVSLLGWFGIQNSVFASSLDHALGQKLGFHWAAALSGLTLTLIVAFGFRALRFAARIAVPAFAISVLYISTVLLTGQDMGTLSALSEAGKGLSISDAITLVVGGSIVASLITPDLTRYYSNGRQVMLMTVLTIFAGEYVINGLAVIISVILNTADVVTIMSQVTGGIGLVVVVFSTMRINDINLYSSSLGVANAIEAFTGKKIPYVVITLFIGLAGTTMSVMGILDRFVDFLNLLGVLFPPVIGVMMVDYFILKSDRKVLDESRRRNALPDEAQTKNFGWNAIIASLLGAVAGYYVTYGVPALNSIIAGCLMYLVLNFIKGQMTSRDSESISGI